MFLPVLLSKLCYQNKKSPQFHSQRNTIKPHFYNMICNQIPLHTLYRSHCTIPNLSSTIMWQVLCCLAIRLPHLWPYLKDKIMKAMQTWNQYGLLSHCVPQRQAPVWPLPLFYVNSFEIDSLKNVCRVLCRVSWVTADTGTAKTVWRRRIPWKSLPPSLPPCVKKAIVETRQNWESLLSFKDRLRYYGNSKGKALARP